MEIRTILNIEHNVHIEMFQIHKTVSKVTRDVFVGLIRPNYIDMELGKRWME